MANEGLIIDVDYNITKAEAKQRKLDREFEISKQKAANITKEIQNLNDELERSKMLEQEYSIEAEKIRNRLNQYEKDQLNLTDAQLKKERQRYNELAKFLDKEVAHQNSIENSIAKQNLALRKQNAETANIGDQILLNGKKQNKFAQSFEKSQKSADRFGKRLRSLIASALFFSVVTKAFTALRNEFGKLITETGTKTAKLVSQLNGNLAVIGRTLYESAKPAIENLLQVLVQITNVLANGLAKILGKNINQMKELTKQTKKTGKEAKGSVASFDQINTVSSNENTSDSGVGTDFGALNSSISDETALLMTILSGALLVLGVILTFTGVNIPLGLGLIVAGAVGMAATLSASWDTMSQKTKDTITGILGIGGALFLLLGLILILTGVGIPLGIGCILLGVSAIGGAVALSPGDTFLEKVKNLWKNCKEITKNFINWFSENVLDKLFGESIGDTFDNIFDSWCFLFEDLIAFFKAIAKGDWKKAGKYFVNVLIDLLNIFIQQLVSPFQLIIGGVSKLTGLIGKLFDKDWEFDTSWTKVPKIPRLATGAVLPGGSPMLAWVNDQPKGQTYVEGSVDNIVKAFEQYLSGRNFGNTTQDNRPIVLQIDGKEIARATRNGENKLGSQTVFGGFANVY